MQRRFVLAIAFLVCLPLAASATPLVNVGNYTIKAGTKSTVINIPVTGTPAVAGDVIKVSLGDGGAENGGSDTSPPLPTISAMSIVAGTIFASNNNAPLDFGNGPGIGYASQHFWEGSVATNAGTVSANGTLVVVTIDATLALPGIYAFNMSGTPDGDSDFAGDPMTIQNGTITIQGVPEPASMALALFAAAGLGVVALRRRRAA